MSLKVTVKSLDQFCLVEIDGILKKENLTSELSEAMGEVVKKCRPNNHQKILMICKLKGNIPAYILINLVSECEQLFGWMRSWRLAIVHLNGKKNTHKAFMENVAYNRGYILHVFDDIETAETWLLDEKHQHSLHFLKK